MWETTSVTNDVLRQAPLFNGLDDDASNALENSMTEVSLRRGETLFEEGDGGDRLYVVIEGKIKLGRSSVDGRENLLATLATSAKAARSNSALSSNGFLMKRVRSIEPRQQQPYGGSGCSAQL